MSVVQEEKSQVICLTKGNLKVLSVLEKWGVLGFGQIDGLVIHKDLSEKKRIELFFNSVQRKDYGGAAYKGIVRLEEAGYVRSHSYTNLPRVYTLTSAGHGILKRNGVSRLPSYCGEVAETLVRHELTVSAVGLVLSELLGLRVWTEMERYLASDVRDERVKKSGLGLSDLWIEDREQPKAVEVERTQKSASRYEELWDDYRKKLPPTGVVLYVACFPGGSKCLLRRAERLRADHIYVCDLESFKASGGRAPFVGYRGGRVVLVSESERPAPIPAPEPAVEPLLARPEFRLADWRPR